jgi:hypothetical protein
MLEYRIPIARIISTAIIGVCFLIALFVISMQGAGRRRVFGLLGITMVLTSTFLQAVNNSQGSVFGTNTVTYGVLTVAAAAVAAVGLVLLALAVIRPGKASTARGDH